MRLYGSMKQLGHMILNTYPTNVSAISTFGLRRWKPWRPCKRASWCAIMMAESESCRIHNRCVISVVPCLFHEVIYGVGSSIITPSRVNLNTEATPVEMRQCVRINRTNQPQITWEYERTLYIPSATLIPKARSLSCSQYNRKSCGNEFLDSISRCICLPERSAIKVFLQEN